MKTILTLGLAIMAAVSFAQCPGAEAKAAKAGCCKESKVVAQVAKAGCCDAKMEAKAAKKEGCCKEGKVVAQVAKKEGCCKEGKVMAQAGKKEDCGAGCEGKMEAKAAKKEGCCKEGKVMAQAGKKEECGAGCEGKMEAKAAKKEGCGDCGDKKMAKGNDEFMAEAHRMMMAAEGKQACCKSTATKVMAKGDKGCCNEKGQPAKFKVWVGNTYAYFGCEGSAAKGRAAHMAKGARVGKVQKVTSRNTMM